MKMVSCILEGDLQVAMSLSDRASRVPARGSDAPQAVEPGGANSRAAGSHVTASEKFIVWECPVFAVRRQFPGQICRAAGSWL